MKRIMFFGFLLTLTFNGWSQNLENYFDRNEVEGCITLFDYNKKEWISSNNQKVDEGTLPASTFKILHSLIVLEEEVIEGINDTIKWDGIPKKFKSFEIASWNQDTDLEMAFENSTVWYYTELAEKIKRRKYQKYLKKSKYGNGKIRKGKGNDFWNFGEFRVSPRQQIALLIKLYEEELPFAKSNQQIVKSLMIVEEKEDCILRSKTGWCYDREDIGWYVGYVEWNQKVIFFATRIRKDLNTANKNFSKLRKSITKEILTDYFSLEL